MSDSEAAPEAGQIVFADRHQPPLQAGKYRITVRHAVTIRPKTPQEQTETTGRSYTLGVRGERLALDKGELLGVFPPAGSEGLYGQTFPHVVFARRTLPWERSPALQGEGPEASWLALLAFDGESAPKVQRTTFGALTAPGDDKTKAGYASAFAEAGKPFGPEVGESESDPCDVIDLDADTFAALAPTLADLALLAHVRTVSQARKAGPETDATDHATLVCGALARRRRGNDGPMTVHLVSLEGLARYLPERGDKDGTVAPSVALGGRTLRLVTLANWTFFTHRLPVTFHDAMAALDCGPFALPPPPKGAPEALSQAFALGYAALPHALRIEGAETTSWIRGPLLPCAPRLPASLSDLPHYPTADAALGFDPATRMFDVSYAAAWNVGRWLMLSARDIAVTLAGYKQAVSHAVLAAALPSSPAPTLATSLAVSGLKRAAGVAAAGPPDPLARAVALATRLLAAPAAAPVARKGPARRSRARIQLWAARHDAAVDVDLLRAAADEVPRPPAVEGWLKGLVALQGAPLAYLAPDPALLPMESIRFFQLDSGWVSAMLEGACAVGRSATAQGEFDVEDYCAGAMRQAAFVAAGLDGEAGASGFLLRSSALDIWPGMEFEAARADGPVPPEDVLRHELIAPGVLMFLARGAIASVIAHEPSEGLHFGVAEPDQDAPGVRRTSRPWPPNIAMPAPPDAAPVALRPGGAVVDIAALARDLKTPASPALFAYQLVEGVESFGFKVEP